MSKPRHHWWGYVKSMIRRYPDHDNEDERAAVRAAIEQTEHMSNGRDRLKIVDMVLRKKTHTLEGAAHQIPCHYETARHWHTDFIKAVARNFNCRGLR